MTKKTAIIGIVGLTLDGGFAAKRWNRWRPTISLFQNPDWQVDRIDLIAVNEQTAKGSLTGLLTADIRTLSASTDIATHSISVKDPWDFAEMYGELADFADRYTFDLDTYDYYVHITTGTHAAQICLFLLCETRAIPAKLVQSSPGRPGTQRSSGWLSFIDLDLDRYDKLAARFAKRADRSQDQLKAGIATQSKRFNQLIADLERVIRRSRDPILLAGATGTGKSALAERIYWHKRNHHLVAGEFVAVNCATLRGDGAMSALFGHNKGAFTGATESRTGYLRKANGGVLFLDEIGELGLEEQAMLLTAIETKQFYPVGADKTVRSEFVLIAGSNRDLALAVERGRFRDDLLARIAIWQFELPTLADRPEDIEPNLEFELNRVSDWLGQRVSMSKEARIKFVEAAKRAAWPGNFRDFGAAIRRMATLCEGGRIAVADVVSELTRTRAATTPGENEFPAPPVPTPLLETLLGTTWHSLDRFDQVQLADVVAVCANAKSLSDAGRSLFAASLEKRSSSNDADRLRKYLLRFGLSFAKIQREQRSA